MSYCKFCGEYHRAIDMTIAYDDWGDKVLVCEDCIIEKFNYCDECEEYHYNSNTTRAYKHDTEVFVCDNCRDEYYILCEECDEWYHDDDIEYINNERYVCQDCIRENYYTCEGCGRYIHSNDTYYLEDDDYGDNPLCYSCYVEENQRCEENIYNYHSFSNFSERETDEEFGKDNTYFGFELEVSGDRKLSNDFLEYFNDTEDVILMNDGSIDNGFEIITQPMTYNYYKETFKPQLDKGLEFLRRNGFKSHNKGGLHIHFSERYVSKDQIAQMSQILYGSERDKRTWLRLSQRRESAMQRWSSMDNTKKSFYKIKEQGDYDKSLWDTRYTALNYDSRTKTYEIRIFNGNIRLERFEKNFECVLALLDYTKENEKNERPVCNTTGFLKFVRKHKEKYPHLNSFIDEFNIITLHTQNSDREGTESMEVAA